MMMTEQTWKPIETAPNEVEIIVATSYGVVYCEVENWMDSEFECFFSYNYGRIYNATHWMPLPAAPKVTE